MLKKWIISVDYRMFDSIGRYNLLIVISSEYLFITWKHILKIEFILGDFPSADSSGDRKKKCSYEFSTISLLIKSISEPV